MKKIFLFIFISLVVTNYAFAKLTAMGFPKTFADTSFTTRMDVKTEGYKPFMNQSAYTELNIVPGEEIFTDSMIAKDEALTEQQNQDSKTMTIQEYCAKYPDDETRCPQQPSTTGTTTQISETTQTTTFTGKTIGGGVVIANNQVIGGSCYPASKDRHFPNKILTTGKYEKISPAFEKGLMTVFRKEGRCGTIKNDPCGYTCYGIGSGSKCAGVVVNSIAEAEDFYYERFWKKYNIGKLPDVIATDIFIASMGSGPGTAIKQFRNFLGISSGTTIDNNVVNAVKQYNGDIHNKWMDKRNAFLQNVAQKRYHGSVSRGYANAIELKRKNGCHVIPAEPLYR